MDRINRLLRAASTVLTAAMMAGCAACMIVCALGFGFSWLPVYIAALAGAAIVHAGRRGGWWSIGASAALVLGLGVLIAKGIPGIADALRALAAAGIRADMSAFGAAGQYLALVIALLLGALFALFVRMPGYSPFALMILLAAMIYAMAVRPGISVWAALPGLVSGAAAFGLPGDARKEGVRPVLLAAALALSLAALLLAPAANTTWEPLEQLAERIRSVTEDYIRFHEERIAFSINEEGYDHAGMIGDDVVAMLGGPADPSEDVVMRVETDRDLLLRGTIKRSYTGYSWVDDQPKARYLYYDFTHRGVRGQVFDADTNEKNPAFSLQEASVEMLAEGTSTLFVPAQMAEFEMGLSDAVYYNSAGEIFLTRAAQAGDGYAFSARLPDGEDALITAARERMSAADNRYADMLADYTALPSGIDSRVYALAVELTKDTNNAAEKAYAIQNYLARNFNYTLDGRYPEAGRDFVSWFLLEEKQGYCSYFASAMTVMCRIAGMPARYVEGYYVQAQPSGETIITGKNAHAWVEVYLNGLGWVAFDPTARAVAHERGEDAPPGDGYDDRARVDEPGGNEPNEHEGENAPDSTPNPDPGSNPDPTPDNGEDNPGDAPTPTPEPENDDGNEPPQGPEDPGDSGNDSPDSGDSPDNSNSPENSPEDDSRAWLWILLGSLLLAALIALAVLWVRRRLRETDPLALCVSTRSAQTASLILYRGILTLLNQIGMAPMSGETPEAFARRATLNIENPDYERFVAAVVRSRYSGKGIDRASLDAGRNAYVVFLNGMRRSERLRYHVRRVFNGLGSFESIP